MMDRELPKAKYGSSYSCKNYCGRGYSSFGCTSCHPFRQFESKLLTGLCSLLGIKSPKRHHHIHNLMYGGMIQSYISTMLGTDDNHSYWDLLYVMMAYRFTTHQTTGFLHNLLMLGREISTPLDMMYEVPSSIKPVSQNEWVWQLTAHKVKGANTNKSMLRQKHYHDRKLKKLSYVTYMVKCSIRRSNHMLTGYD